MACVAHVLYYLTVSGYGNPLFILHPPLSFGLTVILTAHIQMISASFSSSLVQVLTRCSQSKYFAFRIWRLTKSVYISGTAMLLNIISFGFGLYVSIFALITVNLVDYVIKMGWGALLLHPSR